MIHTGISCDIFCRVIDNFGDIGVTWRLARQLSLEHGVTVRLIVDNLASLARLAPLVDCAAESQEVCGVAILHWSQDHDLDLAPARLVIEAFAVNLPETYVVAMAAMAAPPVWLNLEYLSAESWVGGHHLLPSPHPRLPLKKYFFFPGFTPATGGLIRENRLLAERDAYLSTSRESQLDILLFAYRNATAPALIQAIRESAKVTRCTVPEGELASTLAQGRDPRTISSGVAAIEAIKFVPQPDFDRLLWRHDVLFVRGEDSFVRAQWAAKPFVWQIYPQSENAHWKKMDAFLDLYCDGLAGDTALALRGLWRAWNAEDSQNIGVAWRSFEEKLPDLRAHAEAWSRKLAQMPDLATNMLKFYQKTTKI